MPDIFLGNTTTVSQNVTDTSSTGGDSSTRNSTTKARTPENHIHTLASFCLNPVGVHFETQDADEEILLFLRPHFITNLPWIAAGTFFILVPLVIAMYAQLFTQAAPIFSFIPSSYITIFIAFYYLVVLSYIFVSFITWFYNISLVTNKRIVDIDYSDVIYHNVAETKLNLVEDTDYTQTGFIRSLFNYGDVFVQTAGEKMHFDFLAVPQPARAVKIVGDLIGKRKTE
ncbi:MAG: hypothetical protein HYT10_00965 [Candidatus Levybacteria bacterium]|nr:hypothetical protein [Candidatus Levybacteria bacterium]